MGPLGVFLQFRKSTLWARLELFFFALNVFMKLIYYFFTRLVSVSYIFDCCTALRFMFSQGVLDLIYSPQSSPLNLFTYTQ